MNAQTNDTNDAYKRTTARDEDRRKCNGGGGNVSFARGERVGAPQWGGVHGDDDVKIKFENLEKSV